MKKLNEIQMMKQSTPKDILACSDDCAEAFLSNCRGRLILAEGPVRNATISAPSRLGMSVLLCSCYKHAIGKHLILMGHL